MLFCIELLYQFDMEWWLSVDLDRQVDFGRIVSALAIALNNKTWGRSIQRYTETKMMQESIGDDRIDNWNRSGNEAAND